MRPICERQLKDWGLEYFDLFYIHFPIALKYVDPSVRYPPGFFYEDNKLELSNTSLEDTYHAMEELYDQGLIKTGPLGGLIERDSAGNPTGMVLNVANIGSLLGIFARIPKLAAEDQITSTRLFMREMNRLGVTGVIDAGGGGQNYPDDYRVVEELHREGQLSLRIAYNLFTQKPKEELRDFQTWASMSVPVKRERNASWRRAKGMCGSSSRRTTSGSSSASAMRSSWLSQTSTLPSRWASSKAASA